MDPRTHNVKIFEVDLGESQIVDCDTQDAGCAGGWMDRALYARRNQSFYKIKYNYFFKSLYSDSILSLSK